MSSGAPEAVIKRPSCVIVTAVSMTLPSGSLPDRVIGTSVGSVISTRPSPVSRSRTSERLILKVPASFGFDAIAAFFTTSVSPSIALESEVMTWPLAV